MFVIIAFLLLVLLYYYGTKNFNYWSQRNVPHIAPIPFFGNNFYNYFQRVSRTQALSALYREFPEQPVVGYYRGVKPELLIRDPEIIRGVLSLDFPHFHARGLGRDPTVEPLLMNLFHGDGDNWKLLRRRLTPAFTSGKLKAMFPLIIECTEQMTLLADRICETGRPYDIRELMARFTTDFIGACGFGIRMNSINDDSSRFRELGKEIFNFPLSSMLKLFLKEVSPMLFNNLTPLSQSLNDKIVNLVKGILEQRNYIPSGRNDFIDLLLELRKEGTIVAESIEKIDESGKPKIVEKEIDDTLMAAQCFIFFAAGFETSSSATSYTLHELAHNPEIQVTVQEEIDRVLANHDGKLCYDAVKEMTYLECTFKEGLRKFPSLGVLNRVCTRKCQVPGTNIWLDKGVLITIPVQAIQNDEKYYENPENFDPTRFLPDVKRHNFVYLPFGEGPRACIGTRLGLMQSMAGMAALLQRYSVRPAPGAPRAPLVCPRSNIVQSVLGGLPLMVIKRSQTPLTYGGPLC